MRANLPSVTHTQLSWLTLARWLVIAYALAMLVRLLVGLALFSQYATSHLDSPINTPNAEWNPEETLAALNELGLPATTMAWVNLGSGLLIFPAAYLVLFLLIWRGKTSWFRVYVAFVCATLAALGETFEPLIALFPVMATLSEILGAIGWQFFFILFYFFPNGQPVPRWSRWLVSFWGGLIVLEVVLQLLTGTGLAGTPYVQVINWLLTGIVFTAIGSQIYRYFWHSDVIQRQQIKLVVYALALMFIIIGGLVIPFAIRPPDSAKLGQDLIVAMIQLFIFRLSFGVVFLSIGIAILRYRLFDIDIIIRRTLQYTILTGLLVLSYWGGIVVLQGLLSPLTGLENHPLVTVITTLGIAALFNPLRIRVQDFIDRRFYRKKYNAEQALAQFSDLVRDEVDMDKLTAALMQVIQETMQPESVRLWLKSTPRKSKYGG